jgi:hypothetical protein
MDWKTVNQCRGLKIMRYKIQNLSGVTLLAVAMLTAISFYSWSQNLERTRIVPDARPSASYDHAEPTMAIPFLQDKKLYLTHVFKARFSEVCGAVDKEISAFTAAVGGGACAQLSCAMGMGRARWDGRHAAWWPA